MSKAIKVLLQSSSTQLPLVCRLTSPVLHLQRFHCTCWGTAVLVLHVKKTNQDCSCPQCSITAQDDLPWVHKCGSWHYVMVKEAWRRTEKGSCSGQVPWSWVRIELAVFQQLPQTHPPGDAVFTPLLSKGTGSPCEYNPYEDADVLLGCLGLWLRCFSLALERNPVLSSPSLHWAPTAQ